MSRCITTKAGTTCPIKDTAWSDPAFLEAVLEMDLTDDMRSWVLAQQERIRQGQDDYPDISA
ncbi:MAG: hypothetical protein JRH15_18385 [Deltaproteobacteria bacterium]|nr:hypothetical protein [Deltaproteobacteria bacterium]